jgi:hypothetical protein
MAMENPKADCVALLVVQNDEAADELNDLVQKVAGNAVAVRPNDLSRSAAVVMLWVRVGGAS